MPVANTWFQQSRKYLERYDSFLSVPWMYLATHEPVYGHPPRASALLKIAEAVSKDLSQQPITPVTWTPTVETISFQSLEILG